MSRFKTLLLREWLQHKFAWSLMVLIPLALGLMLTGVGEVQLEDTPPAELPLLVTLATVAGTAISLGGIAAIAALISITGLARRDHADRSHEFWLSLPIDHGSAYAAPLLVHLLIVPVAAMAIGWLAGLALSMVLTSRIAGFDAWLSLPWGTIIAGTLSVIARIAAGLPLALLWLSPLILVVVLLCAWFRRWGLVIFAVALLAAALAATQVFGSPWPAETVAALVRQAGLALVTPDSGGVVVRSGEDAVAALSMAPAWAAQNFGLALTRLASPLLLGGLIVAAGCFVALMDWRRRGVGGAA